MFGIDEDPREAVYESVKRRERRERIQKEIDPMPLSAFTVSELSAVLVFLGFRLDPRANGQFLTLAEAENRLEKKLLRAAQDRSDCAESGLSRKGNLYDASQLR